MNPLIFVFTSLFLSTEVSIWAIEQVQEDFFGNNSYCDRWFRIWNSESSKICSVSVSSRDENSLLLFLQAQFISSRFQPKYSTCWGLSTWKNFQLHCLCPKSVCPKKLRRYYFRTTPLLAQKNFEIRKQKDFTKESSDILFFLEAFCKLKMNFFVAFGVVFGSPRLP